MITNVLLYDLPTRIKGFTCETEDGEFICVLNARLSHETNKQTFIHELEHCNKDFRSSSCVDMIEAERHDRK